MIFLTKAGLIHLLFIVLQIKKIKKSIKSLQRTRSFHYNERVFRTQCLTVARPIVFQKIYITSNKRSSSPRADAARWLTVKVRETLMRQDYHDGMTLAAVSHSVAKETVSLHPQRVPVLRAGGWVDESTWERRVAAATREGATFFCSL